MEQPTTSNDRAYQSEKQTINNCEVEIVSYQINGTYYCHVNNIDPGATIARGKGADRATAVSIALEKVHRRV